jgi:hypothetical protein
MKRIGKTLQMRALDLVLLALGVGIILLAHLFPDLADALKVVGGGLCGLALPQIGKWWGTPATEETVTVTTTTSEPPGAA